MAFEAKFSILENISSETDKARLGFLQAFATVTSETSDTRSEQRTGALLPSSKTESRASRASPSLSSKAASKMSATLIVSAPPSTLFTSSYVSFPFE